jgi:ompA/motB
MALNDEDTTTRTGLWVVFSTVTILLVSLIIWVLRLGGADTEASQQPAALTQAGAQAGQGHQHAHPGNDSAHEGHDPSAGQDGHGGDASSAAPNGPDSASQNTQPQDAAAGSTASSADSTSAAGASADNENDFVAFDVEGPAEVSGVVHFASASADISAEDAAIIASVVEAFNAADGRNILLAGYHDPTGDATFNRNLAKKRALGARDALIAKGVPAERVIMRKPEQTAGSGTHAEARRVELLLIDAD